MSNPSENLKSSDMIDIDETGRVVVNDPELAKLTEELSQEELDAIAGGKASDFNYKCGVTNNCKPS